MVAAAVIGSAAVGAVASNSASKKAAKASNAAADSATAQTAIAQQQADMAQDQWDTYKSTYQPLEKAYVADAQSYDSQANREEAAGLAASTVSSQYGKARERLTRTPGLDPSSGAYTAAISGLDRDQAAQDAVSQNAARKNVEDTGWARRTDALSLGKGLPAAASAGLSAASGANATAASGLSAIASQQNGLAASIGSSVGGLASTVFNNWPSSTASLSSSSVPMTVRDVSALQTAPTANLSGISWL